MLASSPKSFVLCVSGPSGSGKTSLCDRLARELDYAERSVSITTRPQRPGERSGDDYIFASQEEFQALEKQGKFLETAVVFGNSYGTPLEPVEDSLNKGKVIVIDIDTVGAVAVESRLKDRVVSLFILPPSIEELERRLQERKQNKPEDLKKRLQEAKLEIAKAHKYKYSLENREFEKTYAALKEIVEKERGLGT